MRVLLVEDEPHAGQLILQGLREHGYTADLAIDGNAAIANAAANAYDAILLDIMLPGVDGLTVCRAIRQTGSMVPILVLTGRDPADSRAESLEAGANDFLVKPFEFWRLLARLNAVFDAGARPRMPDALTVGPLTLDTRHQRVSVRGYPVGLTHKEYTILECLARRGGEVVAAPDIAKYLSSACSDDVFSSQVELWVDRLRRKLNAAGAASLVVPCGEQAYRLAI